jgi:hypothetical protein
MLAVTYDNKTYNVLVEKMNNSSSIPKQGGTHRNQSTQRNKRKQNRSKPTRRIKR